MAVKNKTLVQNPALKAAAERAVKGNGRIHLCGLVRGGLTICCRFCLINFS